MMQNLGFKTRRVLAGGTDMNTKYLAIHPHERQDASRAVSLPTPTLLSSTPKHAPSCSTFHKANKLREYIFSGVYLSSPS